MKTLLALILLFLGLLLGCNGGTVTGVDPDPVTPTPTPRVAVTSTPHPEPTPTRTSECGDDSRPGCNR